ncbi:MAG: hypothetical protein CL582_23345 [Alteromonadaceae bacterium]|nr:hypothetical protein [Alteromonadaceae bacterium]|tara:strand:- start:10375 stop:11502 length:1128 start_codon:yes stop_codon:yes gene_type:complete
MDDINFDKGSALEILRYTAKTAAAPAVGIGGPPPQEPGPLVPGGGGTLGGSNNPQMQTGWAAGAMRKSLIKKFTANASKQQSQNVNVAASKQVGGMGSGMPKMSSIGKHLEKQAFLPALGRAAAAARPLAQRGLAALKSGAGRYGKWASKPAAAAKEPILKSPFSVPNKFAPYIEPAKAGWLERAKWFGSGTGGRSIYRSKETGQLIQGGMGPLGRAPKGYELATKYHQTGGIIPSAIKKGIRGTAGGAAAGYGGSYVANPGEWSSLRSAAKTITDPRRREMARFGGKLGLGFSSIPGFAVSGVGSQKLMKHKGLSRARSLGTGKGGRWDQTGPKGGDYLDILKGTGKPGLDAKTTATLDDISRMTRASRKAQTK